MEAVAISSFWHSLLGCDRHGAPLTPVLTWADARASQDAARLRARHHEAAVHRASGCMLRASFWPAKLAWLARTQPRTCARVRRWTSPASWLVWRWSGQDRAAHGMATGTGLYDLGAPVMVAPAAGALRRRAGAAEPGRRRAARARACAGRVAGRSSRGRAFHPAIGDGAASNLGSGATRPGLAAINVGTSAAVRAVRARAPVRAPLGLFCYRIDSARFLVGGAISNAGSVVDWCQRHLRLPPRARLEAALVDPRADALQALPYLMAERSPSWRDDIHGALVGLSQSTDAVAIYRALTMASYLRLAQVAELMRLPPATRLVVGGGILHSPASVQRLCDAIGRPLALCAEPEMSLRGAAVLALERAGAHAAAARDRARGRARAPPPPRALGAARASLARLEERLYGRSRAP